MRMTDQGGLRIASSLDKKGKGKLTMMESDITTARAMWKFAGKNQMTQWIVNDIKNRADEYSGDLLTRLDACLDDITNRPYYSLGLMTRQETGKFFRAYKQEVIDLIVDVAKAEKVTVDDILHSLRWDYDDPLMKQGWNRHEVVKFVYIEIAARLQNYLN